jgi:hypothetical protein
MKRKTISSSPKFSTRVGSFKLPTKNLVRLDPAPTSITDSTRKIIPYGAKNDLPNQFIKAIQESATASACIDTLSKFIDGDGFLNKDLAKLMVNRQENADTILGKISEDVSHLEKFAIVVKYDEQQNPIAIHHLPAEGVRWGIPDERGYVKTIVYNPYFGTSLEERKYDETYTTYNPSKDVVLSEQLEYGAEYNGQVFYWNKERPGDRFYGLPYYYGALDWFKVDADIASFHKSNLQDGFLQQILFKMIGDPNAPSMNPDHVNITTGKSELTVGEAFDEDMQDLSGSDSAKAMTIWAQTKEQFPEIQAFPTNANHDLFVTIENQVKENICTATGVPQLLANIQVSGKLGNTKELENSIVQLQMRVNPYQRAISTFFAEIIPLMGYQFDTYDIANINYFKEVPEWVFQNLNKETIEQYIEDNYPITIIKTLEAQPIDPIQVSNQYAYGLDSKQFLNVTSEAIAERYKEYHDTVNISYSKLEQWASTECSRLAGLSRAPITRNLELLLINKPDWTAKHYRWAGQTIAFINRMKEVEAGDPMTDNNGRNCGSKRTISLKNWAFNPE